MHIKPDDNRRRTYSYPRGTVAYHVEYLGPKLLLCVFEASFQHGRPWLSDIHEV